VQKTVVLGAGHWHLPLYRDAFLQHHEIVGVWDRSADAAARAAADLGTTAYASVAECLAAGPELAYVLGVHAEMPGICRQLIAAGVPFVLEKPGAAAVADLAAVRDEAAASGVPATVALVQRYGPLPALLARAGAPRHLRFSFVAGPPSRYVDAGCGWVLDRSISGGGCLYLLGVHFTDMLRHVTGQQITEARSVRQYPEGSDTEDYGVLTLSTGDGTIATVEIGWTFPVAPVKRYVNYTAVGSLGHLAVDTAGGVEFSAPGQAPVRETVDVDSDAIYPIFVAEVADRHETGFAGMPTLTDLVEAMRAIEESYSTS
jgi:predicted dehydrogenase